jgi:predicted component of type VI protein secretion system
MKINTLAFLSLAGTAALLAGCINTVSGTKTGAVPTFTKDRVQARYERPAEAVYNAAKEVVAHNGSVTSAGSLYNQTNDVRVLSGKIQQDDVWIRVEGIEPRLTALTVQTRTSHGMADRDLAIEIDKEVALQLAR